MTWNHRLMAHQGDDEVFLEIHEVYYDKNGDPEAYTSNGISVGGETIKEINWVLQKMKDCLQKPILWADEKWPEEYISQDQSTYSTTEVKFIEKVTEIKEKWSEQTRKLDEHLNLINEAFEIIDNNKDSDLMILNRKLKDIEDRISNL